MKPQVLLLTNESNDGWQEDALLKSVLRNWYDIVSMHPAGVLPLAFEGTNSLEKHFDLVFIRNIWPVHEYQGAWDWLAEKLQPRIATYNPLTGKGDQKGKTYLTELWKQGMPVVPTAASIDDVGLFPNTLAYREYVVKPLFSGDGAGMYFVPRDLIRRQNLEGKVVQPYLEFSEELGFYFLDNKFHHAVSFKDKMKEHEPTQYKPTNDEIALAERFVSWNGMPYGLQRIDFLRVEGNLLMNEVEDLCPYLNLLETPERQRERFIEDITLSIGRAIATTKNQASTT